MKELSLQELKEIELDMLKMFDVFCKNNDISYYLSHGTLLGAIRYKKFIPWDDDIDLLIPRQDYERMLSLFEDNEHYRLFAFEKNPEYRYPFAKLCDMTTRKNEFGYDNGVELGVDIDLFPLDVWDGNPKKARQEVRTIRKNMYCLDLTKMKKPDSKNPIKRTIKGMLMACCKVFGSGYFLRKIKKYGILCSQDEKKYLGCKVWCVYGEKGIIPSEVFDDVVKIEFEGHMFPAPIGYDTYLTCLYGDYLPEPPKERQKTHHRFMAYRM